MSDSLVKLIVVVVGCCGLAWTVMEVTLHVRGQSNWASRLFHFLIYLLISAVFVVCVVAFEPTQTEDIKALLPWAAVAVAGLATAALVVSEARRRSAVSQLTAAQQDVSGYEELKRTLGLKEVVAERDDRHYDEILRSADSIYYCMGISLPDVTAFPFLARLADQMVSNPRLQARFLLVNPFCWSALQKARSAVYGKDPEGLILRIADSVTRLRQWHKGLSAEVAGRVSLKLYRAIPNTSIVMNESMVNLSFYDELKAANRTPSLVLVDDPHVNPERDLYQYYVRHYEAVWNRPDNIDGFSVDLKRQLDHCLDAMPGDIKYLEAVFRKAKARDLLE